MAQIFTKKKEAGTIPRLEGQKEEVVPPELRGQGHTVEVGTRAGYSGGNWSYGGDRHSYCLGCSLRQRGKRRTSLASLLLSFHSFLLPVSAIVPIQLEAR